MLLVQLWHHLPTEDHASPPPAGFVSAWGSVVDVGGQMFGQIVGPGKALAAGFAVVGSFTGVDPQVPCEVRLASEGSTTEQTHEGTLSGVLSDV